MKPSEIAQELEAILTYKGHLLTPTEVEAIQNAIVDYRHKARLKLAKI